MVKVWHYSEKERKSGEYTDCKSVGCDLRLSLIHICYLSFYATDSDVIRITGYLVKRSEIEKLEKGENVLQDTTALGMGAKHNGHILERKVR